MKTKKQGIKRFLESKTTTMVVLVLLLTPFLVFGYIIYRDSSQTGQPVVGSRYDNQLDPAISKDQLKEIEDKISDVAIISKKVVLKSSTLRVYLEVDESTSKKAIEELGNTTYSAIVEILPIETYFTLTGNKKMYDLEVHVYNNAQDRDSDEFIYFEIIKASSIEEHRSEFVSDVRDPEYREEVLENLAAKEAEAAAEAGGENEDDKGGE